MEILIAPIGVFMLIKVMKKSSAQFAYAMDNVMLNAPLIGELTRKSSVARYAQTFGTLYKSGINVVKALGSARQTVTNAVLIKGLEEVEKSVQNGKSISDAFAENGQFPSLVVRMIKVGESSGNLTPVLDKVSEFYNKDVDETIDGLIGLVQPTLTAVMAGLILWIAASVFGPIYSSFENINF